jgi:hypothetical protein
MDDFDLNYIPPFIKNKGPQHLFSRKSPFFAEEW